MLSVQVPDVSHVLDQLHHMQHNIRDLKRHGIVAETRDWEVQDVHRHRPGARHTRSGAITRFRPHSKYEMARHRAHLRKLARHGVKFVPSTRPILRRMLIDQLWERVTRLVSEKLKWKS